MLQYGSVRVKGDGLDTCPGCIHPLCSGDRHQQTTETLLRYKVGRMMDEWMGVQSMRAHRRGAEFN